MPRPPSFDAVRAAVARLARAIGARPINDEEIYAAMAAVTGATRAVERLVLPARHEYATISRVNQADSFPGLVPRRRRGRRSTGPVAAIATELGFDSMHGLAAALGEADVTLRSWNKRKSVPEGALKKIAAMRAERAAKSQA